MANTRTTTTGEHVVFRVQEHSDSSVRKLSYSARYATLYEAIDLGKRGAAFEPVLFLIRRTILAAMLVLMPS